MIEQTQRNINSYAREGLRILVMAKRHLTYPQYQSWLSRYKDAETDITNRDHLLMESYNFLERNLELVGATGIEDRLQEGVPEAIESLRKAGIVMWVLTGDKQETAVNIAYSCRLFTSTMDIININAKSKSAAGDTITFYLEEVERLKREATESPPIQTRLISHNPQTPPLTSNKERALVVDGKTLT
jgi:phospholipid-translocating ATPase